MIQYSQETLTRLYIVPSVCGLPSQYSMSTEASHGPADDVKAYKLDDVEEAKQAEEQDDDDFVDPWKVESKSAKGVDYDKLISKLKCSRGKLGVLGLFSKGFRSSVYGILTAFFIRHNRPNVSLKMFVHLYLTKLRSSDFKSKA